MPFQAAMFQGARDTSYRPASAELPVLELAFTRQAPSLTFPHLITMKSITAILALAVTAVAAAEAPLYETANARHIPNAYIVKLKDHVKQSGAAAHHSWGKLLT